MKTTSNLKDKVTTGLSIALMLGGAVNTYLQANAGQPINWSQLGMFVVTAAIAYFTGKNPDGSTKSPEQVAQQNSQSK